MSEVGVCGVKNSSQVEALSGLDSTTKLFFVANDPNSEASSSFFSRRQSSAHQPTTAVIVEFLQAR
jgi:hypothetical protein